MPAEARVVEVYDAQSGPLDEHIFGHEVRVDQTVSVGCGAVGGEVRSQTLANILKELAAS